MQKILVYARNYYSCNGHISQNINFLRYWIFYIWTFVDLPISTCHILRTILWMWWFKRKVCVYGLWNFKFLSIMHHVLELSAMLHLHKDNNDSSIKRFCKSKLEWEDDEVVIKTKMKKKKIRNRMSFKLLKPRKLLS